MCVRAPPDIIPDTLAPGDPRSHSKSSAFSGSLPGDSSDVSRDLGKGGHRRPLRTRGNVARTSAASIPWFRESARHAVAGSWEASRLGDQREGVSTWAGGNGAGIEARTDGPLWGWSLPSHRAAWSRGTRRCRQFLWPMVAPLVGISYRSYRGPTPTATDVHAAGGYSVCA
jgi:hypothetical protein